ncbi:MAG: nickel-responsive transcriptional regulator NikR [Candidatus Bathyarchaeales archaeon]
MSARKGVVRFSISLPPKLVNEFDEAWKGMGYDNRSKAAHDAFRSFISEYKWTREEAGKIVGAIVLVYYLDKPSLLNEIIRVQHEFEGVISSVMHIHLAKDKCLELIAVKGKVGKVRELSQELAAKKGVKQLKLAAIAL